MHAYLFNSYSSTFNRTEQNSTYKTIFHISIVCKSRTNMRAMWNISIKWQRRNYFWISITLTRLFTLNFLFFSLFLAINWKFIYRIELAIRAYTRFTRTKCVHAVMFITIITFYTFFCDRFLWKEMFLMLSFVWLTYLMTFWVS